ncbi:HRDC domain protein [Fibrisoma limi BUZ 3]|uniref:HRDC domain protein n=1 Tax=Fibrisoma limi BUZ 3 TaxID=1185876 RepID=I2GDN5_9BACT|nr:helix-turn-helix domain-containing protein [Fibrisoma limi]CCH52009.1 HRDC domain protein [Fibrisoma limi BUZ 3]
MPPVNEKLELAYNFVLHTNRNVFLTGKAGTGKTTFLHQIKQASAKRLMVVAPTGVAAMNAGGVTIHSLFQLPFGPIVPGAMQRETRKFTREKIRLLRTLDLLVIDEISMVRADVLDGIDDVLRRYRNRSEPFGGVQLLMIGDMQQLPPVIKDEDWALLKPHYQTGYFFGSKALRVTPYVSIELTHIYRQSDAQFISLLNGIREKTITRTQLDELNQRYIPEFSPDEKEGYITLSTHNASAQQINTQKLQALKGRSRTYTATVEGECPVHTFPTEAELELKVGAQVMFIKNDISRDKLYYNGKIGRIVDLDDDVIYVRCPSDDDDIAVYPVEWTNVRYSLDPATKEIKAEPIGRFVQFPLKLAWAITIHKSQGLTFEKAIIDASAAFAHGQVYVALSRCKSLEGLVLRTPIPSHSIKTEQTLEDFHEQVQQRIPTEQELLDSKRTNQENLLRELFSFELAASLLYRAQKLVRDSADNLPEELSAGLNQLNDLLREKAREVTIRFQQQLSAYFADNRLPEENESLQERVSKAGAYFQTLIGDELLPLLRQCPTDCDNQQIREAVVEVLDELEKELFTKLGSFESCQNGFRALTYLQARNRAELDFQPARRKVEVLATDGSTGSSLYKALIKWRNDKAGEHDTSGYMVLPQKTVYELVKLRPTTTDELLAVKGFGKTKVKQIGAEVLQIIREYAGKPERREAPAKKSASAKPKKEKIDTRAITLALFQAGRTIEEIAAERNMAVSTIEGHLAQYVRHGEVSLDALLPPNKLKRIQQYFASNQPSSLSEAKNALGKDVTYGELRFVLNALRSDE